MKYMLYSILILAFPLFGHDEEPVAPSELLRRASGVILASPVSQNTDGEAILQRIQILRGVAPTTVTLSMAEARNSALKVGKNYILFLADDHDHHSHGHLVEIPFVGAAAFVDEPMTRALFLGLIGESVNREEIGRALNTAITSNNRRLQRYAALEMMFKGMPDRVSAQEIVNLYTSRDPVARGFLLHVAATNKDRFPQDWFLKKARAELNNGLNQEPVLLEQVLDLVGFFGNGGDMSVLESFLDHEHPGVFAAAWSAVQTRDRQRAAAIAAERVDREDLKEHQRRTYKANAQ